MPTKSKPTRSALPINPTLTKTAPAAFASIRAEIQAIPASDIGRINLDMARAARRGLAVAERLVPLYPKLAQLHDLDLGAIKSLRTRALAVLHTDELVHEGGGATARLTVLLAEAGPLRELMLSSAEALALAGLVSNERVVAIRRGQGHADTAEDLQALGRLYRELWDHVHDKVPVTFPMVERATTLSAELQAALGLREIGEEDPLEEPSSPEHLRAQAFVLFARAYSECRRGVTYLRWHEGDAVGIVPSLYPPRVRRGGAKAADDRELDDEGADEGEGESEISGSTVAMGDAHLDA